MGSHAGGMIVLAALFLAGAPRTPAAENLLRNGSFEEAAPSTNINDAMHWSYAEPDEHGDAWGSASREQWRAVDGQYIGSVRGLWADLGTRGGVWQEATAEPGQSYRFSGWFYCDPEWIAVTQEIVLEFWDADRQTLLGETRLPIAGCFDTWTERSVEGTAPEGTAWARVVVHVDHVGPSGALQFDNLVLVKHSPSPTR
jgi:hypothetical protein